MVLVDKPQLNDAQCSGNRAANQAEGISMLSATTRHVHISHI